MLSWGYLLLCFRLKEVCEETDRFQQGLACWIREIYHKDATNHCTQVQK